MGNKSFNISKENKTMKNKKKLFIAALAICLVAIISVGTLAWFTDEDQVTNKFYVGDTTTDADKVFGIDLWETSDVNGDGTITDDEIKGKDTKDDEGFTYQTILPGELLDKDPYLTNTGIHGQYLRAIVTVTKADILKDAMIPKGSEVSIWDEVEFFLPGTDDKWTVEYKYYTNADTFVFVYYYDEVLEAGATTEKLFDAVVIPTELTKEQAAEMADFEIKIVGQVIQSEHLADVANAKEAFAKYWDEPGVVAGVVIDEDLADPNGPVSISYPVTGTLGTFTSTPIIYDEANYTDPDMPGVLLTSDATATIKSGASFVDVPAEVPNVTMYLKNTALTIEDGSKFITSTHGTGQIILENVTINGEKITSGNIDEIVAKYVTGFNSGNFMIFG